MDICRNAGRQEHRHRPGDRPGRPVSPVGRRRSGGRPVRHLPRIPFLIFSRSRPGRERRRGPESRKTGVRRMSYDCALPLILTFSVGSLFVAWFLASLGPEAGHRDRRHAGDLQRHQGGRRGLPPAPEPHDRAAGRPPRGRDLHPLRLRPRRTTTSTRSRRPCTSPSGRRSPSCSAPPARSSPATSACGSRSAPTSGRPRPRAPP